MEGQTDVKSELVIHIDFLPPPQKFLSAHVWVVTPMTNDLAQQNFCSYSGIVARGNRLPFIFIADHL